MIEIGVHVVQPALEPAHMLGDVAANSGPGMGQAIALGDAHLQHLAPAREERIEGLRGIIGKRPWLGLHPLREERQNGGSDGVGFGELPRGPREIPDLWRVELGGDTLPARRGELGDLEVRLPAASASVDLVYRDGQWERAGVIASILGLLLWGARWLSPRRR